jgi:hypothetical protein
MDEDGSVHRTIGKLTRMPMGARWALAVAQALASAICGPLLRDHPNLKTFTMIENVRTRVSEDFRGANSVKGM